jgi:hypothetical protein
LEDPDAAEINVPRVTQPHEFLVYIRDTNKDLSYTDVYKSFARATDSYYDAAQSKRSECKDNSVEAMVAHNRARSVVDSQPKPSATSTPAPIPASIPPFIPASTPDMTDEKSSGALPESTEDVRRTQ